MRTAGLQSSGPVIWRSGHQEARILQGTCQERDDQPQANECAAAGYTKQASFGSAGIKKREFCAGHALEGMIYVTGRKKRAQKGCTTPASYGVAGSKRGGFWKKHAKQEILHFRIRKRARTGGSEGASVQEAHRSREERMAYRRSFRAPSPAKFGFVTAYDEPVAGSGAGRGGEGEEGEAARPTAAGCIMGYAHVAGWSGEGETPSPRVAGSIMGYAEPVTGLSAGWGGRDAAARSTQAGPFMG